MALEKSVPSFALQKNEREQVVCCLLGEEQERSPPGHLGRGTRSHTSEHQRRAKDRAGRKIILNAILVTGMPII